MEVILYAFATFFAFLLLQIIVARMVRPASEDKFIIVLFVIFPMLLFVGAACFQFFGLVAPLDAVLAYLLFFVLSSSWVASYPAIYASCPTLVMTYAIRYSGERGMTFEEVRKLLGLKENSTARIQDAVHDKWIEQQGQMVRLTPIGHFFVVVFSTYRRLLGLKMETL